jgi:predicted DNA-binding protein (MmcQ/YjbR family)
MTLEQIRNICLTLPGTTEDIKWENHLCFSVGGKLYLVTGADEIPITASFKCDAELFDEITEQEGFEQAPYFARKQWVRVNDIRLLGGKNGKDLIIQSYNLVFEKLTLKMQAQIRANSQ